MRRFIDGEQVEALLAAHDLRWYRLDWRRCAKQRLLAVHADKWRLEGALWHYVTLPAGNKLFRKMIFLPGEYEDRTLYFIEDAEHPEEEA